MSDAKLSNIFSLSNNHVCIQLKSQGKKSFWVAAKFQILGKKSKITEN